MATATLYVKNGNSIIPLELGTGAGSTLTVTRESKVLTETLTAGTAYEVPTHTVGSDLLIVLFDGLLCEAGASKQYVDASATTITFNDDLPAGSEIDVLVYNGGSTSDLMKILPTF